MVLTTIEAVRLKTSDKATIARDVAIGTGSDKYYKLKNAPILATPAIEVRKNGSLLNELTDYDVELDQGIVTMTNVPVVNDNLEFQYYWVTFSDDEVQYFLTESGDNVTIASARLLLAWAADAAKLAKRQTTSGGGGLGQVVIDTSVAAKALREAAAALIKTEEDLGESIPAEGLTEIPWTEANYHQMLDQHYTRD